MRYLLILSLIIFLFGFLEFSLNKKNRKQIPLLIHVNGTRGKSTTTRLIAAGLTGCGYRVMGKTTGTLPILIDENGKERLISRRGVPKIKEQIWVLRQAVLAKVHALVLECMAISPEMQWVLEEKILKADMVLITNVYRDHMEVMGPELQDAARVLSYTIPQGGICITHEGPLVSFFSEEARKKNASFYAVSSDDVTEEMVHSFSYPVFKENIAMALQVADVLNLSFHQFFQGMTRAQPDRGVEGPFSLSLGEQTIYLVNAFAANDSSSTFMMWEHLFSSHFSKLPVIGLFNCRVDRPLRTDELVSLVEEKLLSRMEYLYVFGAKPPSVQSLTWRNQEKIFYSGRISTAEVFLKGIFEKIEGDAVLFGFGNTKGGGEMILNYFRQIGKRKVC